MKTLKFVIPMLMLAFAGSAQAQDQTVSASDGTGEVGDQIDIAITLDSAAGDVQGWSWGVENDEAVATINAVADGSTTATVGSGGGPPAFNTVNIVPGGWTVGVVIDFLGCCTLAPGAGLEMEIATYDAVAEGTSTVCFVNTLGTPEVATVVVISGASIPPATTCGNITVTVPILDPAFTYTAGDASVTIPASPSDVTGITINASIADTESSDDPSMTQGFSMGLGNGPELTATGIASINDLAGLNGGTGPSFFGENLLPDGWTVGVVYNFLGGVFLDFAVDNNEVIEATYDATGVSDGDVSALTWTNDLGTPAVANVVVVSGASIPAAFVDGAISFNEVTTTPFLRGDCNDDGIVNIADGIWTLNELFQSGPSAGCAAACDANGDGMVDASDATYIFTYRFSGGAPPPAPFPDCGDDGGVDCVSSCP